METIKRKSCRAILLTEQNEVLLIKIANPQGQWSGWITPGGGIEPGESEDTALWRELDEELGLKKTSDAIKVWIRFHRFPWNGKTVEQEEVFFLIKTPKFQPSTQALEAEMLDFKELRWWRLEGLKSCNDEFAPRKFIQYLEALITDGPPPHPIEVGV